MFAVSLTLEVAATDSLPATNVLNMQLLIFNQSNKPLYAPKRRYWTLGAVAQDFPAATNVCEFSTLNCIF